MLFHGWALLYRQWTNGAPRVVEGKVGKRKDRELTDGLRSDIGYVVGGTGDVGWRKNQQGAESASSIPRSENKKSESSITFLNRYYAEIKTQHRGDKT